MPYHLTTVVLSIGKHTFRADVPDVDEAKIRLIDAQLAYLTGKKFKSTFTRGLNGSFTCTCREVGKGATTELMFSAEFYMAKGKGFAPKTQAEFNKAEDERINAVLREHERVHAAAKAQYEQHKDEVWTGTQWVPKPAKSFNPVLSVTTKVTDGE